MFVKFLEYIGLGKKIDLSPAGLKDLKVFITIITGLLGFFFFFILPWIYGSAKLVLLLIT